MRTMLTTMLTTLLLAGFMGLAGCNGDDPTYDPAPPMTDDPAMREGVPQEPAEQPYEETQPEWQQPETGAPPQ